MTPENTDISDFINENSKIMISENINIDFSDITRKDILSYLFGIPFTLFGIWLFFVFFFAVFEGRI
jgi:hypothetical protein